MTSSSSSIFERGLDTMLVVYSSLTRHPAATDCEQFIRSRTGWFTTSLSLLEAKAILTKVYGVEAALVTDKLAQLTEGLVTVAAVSVETTLAAMKLADKHRLDLTDAVLLSCALMHQSTEIATDDQQFAQVCRQLGLIVENPIIDSLRQQMAQWEANNLPAKGLPRILHHFHRWLSRNHPQAADDFWSQTGNGSHMP